MILKLEKLLSVLIVALIVTLFIAHNTGVAYGEEGLHVKDGGNVGIGTTNPNSALQVAGPIATALVNTTADYTVTTSDSIVTADASGGGFTLTLPTASGITGRSYSFKKIDSSSNIVKVTGNGVETIDGGEFEMDAQYEHLTVISNGMNWLKMGGDAISSPIIIVTSLIATGGIITDYTDGGINYRSHTFLSGGTFTVTQLGTYVTTVDVLVVGDGGGGGSGGGGSVGGGGGGAGGFRTSTSYGVAESGYTVTVGSGGAGKSNGAGRGSAGSGSTFDTITAAGGGGGGDGSGSESKGGSGGSGGGNAYKNTGGGGAGDAPDTTPDQGSNGGNGSVDTVNYGGGGGGGAGAAGSDGSLGNGGEGGSGTASNYKTGSNIIYAGGGGGGGGTTSGGPGGAGGGGTGATASGSASTAGAANTGGGGGGGNDSRTASDGGSGIVIIKYKRD
jgi:hypothetical protein